MTQEACDTSTTSDNPTAQRNNSVESTHGNVEKL